MMQSVSTYTENKDIFKCTKLNALYKCTWDEVIKLIHFM